jgi:hypothetical protein
MSTRITLRTGILLLMASMATASHAQKKSGGGDVAPIMNVLPVNGRVTDGENKLQGCTITLYRGNEVVEQVATDKAGRYKLQVALGDMHTIEYAVADHMTKRVVMDTRADLPEERLLFAPMVMDVSLLHNDRYTGADTDLLDMPYAIVQWDDKIKAFVQDQNYVANMMRANGALLLMAGHSGKK